MKTAIFIDGANNHAAGRALGFNIDFKRLLAWFNKEGTLVRAFYYTATLPVPEGHDQLRPLTDWLDYNGFKVVSKKAKTFTDPMSGLVKVKGNMDMELAVDALSMADHVDHIVIFSGDGDFAYLVKALQQKGVFVTVISTLCEGVSSQSMIADELRRAADKFIDLQDIRVIIQRIER